MEMKENIIDVLKECFDPEIPIDLWNLGLIYDINLKEENNLYDVNIIMSLTTPGCSMGQHMADDIKSKLKPFTKIKNVHVHVFLFFISHTQPCFSYTHCLVSKYSCSKLSEGFASVCMCLFVCLLACLIGCLLVRVFACLLCVCVCV